MTIQYKAAPVLEIEEVKDEGTVFGYASTFGNVDLGGDRVLQGAYSKSLSSGRRVKMLWQHDMKEVIGGWNVLKEDSTGLWVEGKFNMDVQRGREAHSLMKNDQIEGLSVGYQTPPHGSTMAKDGARELSEMELFEISVVTVPMNEYTLAVAKSANHIFERLKAGDRLTEREFETWLKGLGFSNSQAERAARVHLKGQGEPDTAATDAKAFLEALTA